MSGSDTQSFHKELAAFLLKIQTSREVDVEAFERLDACGQALAREFKDQYLLPKSVLNDLRMATKVLRAEAPYIREEESVILEMASKLEMIFDLMLLGEEHRDRIPGVPRIL